MNLHTASGYSMVHIPIEYATLPSSPIHSSSAAHQSPNHEINAKPPCISSTLEQVVAKLANSFNNSRPGIVDFGFEEAFVEATQISDCDYSTDDDVEMPSPEQMRATYSKCQENGSSLVNTQFAHNKFPGLLRALGLIRNEVAKQHMDCDAKVFGKLREVGRKNSPLSFSTPVSEKNYPQHTAALTTFLKKNITRSTDSATTAEYLHHYTAKNGNRILTTEIGVSVKDLDLEQIPCMLMHTNTKHLEVLLQEASELFNTMVTQVNSSDKKGAINSLSQFVYLFAHAMPFHRGSAAVGEMLTHGLLRKIGIHKNFEELKGLDFLAFTNTQESFEAAFRAKLEL